MSIKERVAEELGDLGEDDLRQVAEFLAFLKYRARMKATPLADEKDLAAVYAEFEEEDRELAEQGMSSYHEGLMEEDRS